MNNNVYQLSIKIGDYWVNCAQRELVDPPSATGLGGKLQCPTPDLFCKQIITEGNCKGSCFARGECIENRCICHDGWTFHNCLKKTYVRG